MDFLVKYITFEVFSVRSPVFYFSEKRKRYKKSIWRYKEKIAPLCLDLGD
jgi:hypothetical protein